MISDIMHSFAHDKGKLVERRGRKTTGLRGNLLAAGLPNTTGLVRGRVLLAFARQSAVADTREVCAKCRCSNVEFVPFDLENRCQLVPRNCASQVGIAA